MKQIDIYSKIHNMPGKLNLENLTFEEKEKLKEYVASVKEIKKEIGKLIKKGKIKEDEGNNMSKGLYLNLKK